MNNQKSIKSIVYNKLKQENPEIHHANSSEIGVKSCEIGVKSCEIRTEIAQKKSNVNEQEKEYQKALSDFLNAREQMREWIAHQQAVEQWKQFKTDTTLQERTRTFNAYLQACNDFPQWKNYFSHFKVRFLNHQN